MGQRGWHSFGIDPPPPPPPVRPLFGCPHVRLTRGGGSNLGVKSPFGHPRAIVWGAGSQIARKPPEQQPLLPTGHEVISDGNPDDVDTRVL